MDLDSVLRSFEGIDINWNPDLLVYRKSFYDHWSFADMNKYDSRISLKECPQFYVKFGQPEGGNKFSQGEDIIKCWVVISKLLVMHKNGEFEAEENSKDYIAMHVYPNSEKGTKVLTTGSSLIRSKYSSEQT